MFGWFARLRPVVRYGAVAVIAFVLGTGTVTAAAAAGFGSLFYVSSLNGLPTTPCSTSRGTVTCFAVVDDQGRLTVTDSETQRALQQFKFDSSGNLKVSSVSPAVAPPTIASIVGSPSTISLSSSPTMLLTGTFTGAPLGTVIDSFGNAYTVASGAPLIVDPTGPNHGPGSDTFILTVINQAGSAQAAFTVVVTA